MYFFLTLMLCFWCSPKCLREALNLTNLTSSHSSGLGLTNSTRLIWEASKKSQNPPYQAWCGVLYHVGVHQNILKWQINDFNFFIGCSTSNRLVFIVSLFHCCRILDHRLLRRERRCYIKERVPAGPSYQTWWSWGQAESRDYPSSLL